MKHRIQASIKTDQSLGAWWICTSARAIGRVRKTYFVDTESRSGGGVERAAIRLGSLSLNLRAAEVALNLLVISNFVAAQRALLDIILESTK